MKNIEGFLVLTIMLDMAKIVAAVPGEVLNLLANHKEYKGALLIFTMGVICCIIGANLYEEFIKRIKQ